MPKMRSMTLKFPAGGINRRFGFQDQPPYTTPYAINIWPDSHKEGRAQGGKRPGTSTAIDGYGNTFSSLTNVRGWVETNIAPTASGFEKKVFAFDSGALKKHNNSTGAWNTVSSSLTLATDRSIRAVAFLDKILIADWGVTAAGTDGVTTSSGTVFDAASIANWTTVANANDFVLQIYSGNNIGTYYLSAVASGSITLEGAGTGDDETSLTWRITRALKVYDLPTDTLSLWRAASGKGMPPHGCRIVTVSGERVILANDGHDPHVWYMPRAGTHNDFLYGESDRQAAVSANEQFNGVIGEPISCVIPHNRECTLFGSPSSFYVMRGDPMQRGVLERLSHQIGPIAPRAWCKDNEDNTFFLTRDGLYEMPPGCGVPPKLVSDKIPDELKVITDNSLENTSIEMAYDFVTGAVQVIGAPGMAGTEMWWYDTTKFRLRDGSEIRGGFWKMDYAETLENFPPGELGTLRLLREYDLTSESNRGGAIFITSGGAFLQPDINAISDSDPCYLAIGPFRLSRDSSRNGAINELRIITSEQQSPSQPFIYDLDLYVGPSFEQVLQAALPSEFGTATAHVNHWTVEIGNSPLTTSIYSHYPRLGGGPVGLVFISNETFPYFRLEEIYMAIAEHGMARYYPVDA